MEKVNKKNITMRIRPDVYDKVRKIAYLKNRSFANFIEYLLMNEIETAKKSGMKFKN